MIRIPLYALELQSIDFCQAGNVTLPFSFNGQVLTALFVANIKGQGRS